MVKLKINGLSNSPKWKKIQCYCDKNNLEKSHPIKKCIHCQCERAQKSMPTEIFEIITIDANGKESVRKIKEITIDRTDDGTDMIRGWYY